MGDELIRNELADLEGYAFDEAPWTSPRRPVIHRPAT